MPSYVPPQYGVAYITYVTLVDQSNTKLFKSSPTLATGDVKISIDGAALADITTLPTVTPAAGRRVKVSLSAAEMTGDNIGILFNDAAGSEWCDLFINIQTSARRIDDLAYPATSGRSTAIDASGQVTVGAIAANAITAASIATDAIDADSLKADAVTEIQNGLATASALATVDSNVDTLVASITTTAAVADAIWDEALSGHLSAGTTGNALNAAGAAGDPWSTSLPGAYGAGSAGKLIGDNINATMSSRATQVSVDDLPTNAELATSQAAADDATLAAIAALSIPTAAATADAVWDEAMAGHLSAGSTGAALDDAGGAGGGGSTPAELWAYANRSLTQTAAQVQAAITGSDLGIVNAVTFTATLTGLDIGPTWSACYFTMKSSSRLTFPDSDAKLQIRITNGGAAGDGLLYLNSDDATANQASLVVDDDAGTVAIVITDEATAELVARSYEYDLKALMADGSSVLLTSGTVLVSNTPTATIAW